MHRIYMQTLQTRDNQNSVPNLFNEKGIQVLYYVYTHVRIHTYTPNKKVKSALAVELQRMRKL